MQYGKKITHESYFDGKLKSTKIEYSVPEKVSDKGTALSEVMKGLELITSGQTATVTIRIEADPYTRQIRMVTRSYITDGK